MNSIMMILVGGSFLIAVTTAVVVVTRDIRSALYRWLGLFLISAASWSLIVNLQNAQLGSDYNLMIVRLTFVASILMAVSMFHFAQQASKQFVSLAANQMIGIVVVFCIGMMFTPMIISSVSIDGESVVPDRMLPYYLLIGFIIVLCIHSVYLMATAYYMARTKTAKRQMLTIIFGLLVGIVAGVLTNIVLPNITGNIAPAQYSWIATLLWTGTLVYAVIKHRYLDIRLAAMRTAAYIVSLLILAGVYYLLVFAGSSLLVQFDDRLATVGPIHIVAALLLAFLFQPIREFFDRFTNRVFFRDRYSPAEFIAELGDILTSTTQLRTLLGRSLEHITTTLKVSYGTFIVIQDDKAPIVVSTHDKRRFSETDIDILDHVSKTAHRRMVLAGEISEDRVTVHRVFKKNKIAILIPLAHAKNSVGFLVLGEHKAGGYSKRDISMLSSITNELIIAIQNARSLQALRDFNVHLQQSIETATKELRQSNSKLRKLDETKDEFVSMASHQLRTPLTSIKGYISMVLDGDVGKITPQQHRLLNEAFVSSERMVRLIGDFLNVSRIQTGKFMIDAKVVDIKTVVAEEVETLQQMAISHGMKLQYIAPAIVPDISIDEDKTRQVIMNFIDNAIYYSPEGTTITVKLKVDSKHVSLEVHDKGIGVPKDKQAQLFTKFFRADNARKQRPDGTGVGLYLAKKVIEEQGGEIIFHSHVGLGSVFGFKLPIKQKK